MTVQKLQDNKLIFSQVQDIIQTLPKGDPVLVVLWNQDRLDQLQANDPNHTKAAIVQRLLDNGGRDPKRTQSIFHFRLSGDIQSARESFLRNAPWAMGSTEYMRLYLNALPIEPVAETWVVYRISARKLDCSNAQFFYF